MRPSIERVVVASESAFPILRMGDPWARDMHPSPAFKRRHLKYNRKKPLLTMDAELDTSRSEYRVDLTMRDGLPFSSRVVSDGTLRILALLTLLHDPRHRGLVCFEEPENGVHPGRLKQLVKSLRDMVTRPSDFAAGDEAPLSQLLLNSHSPVVLSALVGPDLLPRDDPVFFADTASVADPADKEIRRHTRLRPVLRSPQGELVGEPGEQAGRVSHFEVEKLLLTASADG